MLYRNIAVNFWVDPKVEDEFTPEDRYFYLYLLTNPHTNLCGCYELGMRSATKELGYNEDTINRLLVRMEKVHHVIRYNKDSKEVLLVNWPKYNWSRSPKVIKAILSVAEHIKSDEFKNAIRLSVLRISEKMKDRESIEEMVNGKLQAAETETDIETEKVTDIVVTEIETETETDTDTVYVTETDTDTVSDTDVSIGYRYRNDTVSNMYKRALEHTHTHPSIEEVRKYVEEKGYRMDTDKFYAYHSMRHWEHVVDWKAAVDYWAHTEKAPQKVVENKNAANRFTRGAQRTYTSDQMDTIERGLLANDRM